MQLRMDGLYIKKIVIIYLKKEMKIKKKFLVKII